MKIQKERLDKIIQDELQTLTEGVSDEIYRYLDANELEQTLKNDKFYMTAAVGTGSESDLIKKGKFYFISFTRSRGGDYHQRPSAFSALIKVDGRKLGQRYSGKAVDYWASATRSERGSGRSEAEDRIYSDKPYIPKASQYIKSIHFLIKNSGSPDNVYGDLNSTIAQRVRNVMLLAKKKNIPIFYYNNVPDFIKMNPKKSVKINIQQFKRSVEDIKDKGYQPRNIDSSRSNFTEFLELFYKNRSKDLSKAADRRLYSILYYNYTGENEIVLGNYIHNEKQMRNMRDKRIIHLLKVMKKHRLKTPKDVIEYLHDKWKKIKEEENKD